MPTVALTSSNNFTADTDVYTAAGASLGAETTDRLIVVAVGTRDSATRVPTSVTVGGSSCDPVITQQSASGGAWSCASLWQIELATGTSGDVVVTFAGPSTRCGIDVYRLTGVSSTVYATAGSGALDPSANLTVPTNGVAIGTAVGNAASATAWTGLTEDTDRTVEITQISSASTILSGASSPLTITATFTSDNDSAGAWASWEAAATTGPKAYYYKMLRGV